MSSVSTHLRAGALAALAVVVLAACDDATASPTPTTPTPPVVSPVPSDGEAPAPGSVDWDDPDASVDLGDGWTASRCEGEAPLICVIGDGVDGTVERVAYPVPNPPADGDEVAWLLEAAEDFRTWLEADRAQGCGADYMIAFDGNAQVGADEVTWIRYAFTGTDATGKVVERGVAHLSLAGHVQNVLTANAYGEGGCLSSEGSLWDVDGLAVAVPWLDRLAAATVPIELDGASGVVEGRVVLRDGWTLTLDTAEMLSGDEAIARAREDGVLGPDEEFDGEQIYIRDRGADRFDIELADDAVVTLYDCTSSCQTVDVTATEWLAGEVAPYGGTNALFTITIGEGKVRHLAEVYLP